MTDIPIIYEDNHLLVVEKPVNVPVQADRSRDRDVLNELKRFLVKKYNKPGNAYLGLVHRLDRPVGGAMIFAKTSKAASRLSNQLRLHQIERHYLTVVAGHFRQKSATLIDYLYKDRQTNTSYVVQPRHKQAKKAILHYQVLVETDGKSLLKVTLETGRSHQIRVQLANSKHPIIGDQKYGAHVSRPSQQIALWEYHISCLHPTKKKCQHFYTFPPERFPWSALNFNYQSLRKEGIS